MVRAHLPAITRLFGMVMKFILIFVMLLMSACSFKATRPESTNKPVKKLSHSHTSKEYSQKGSIHKPVTKSKNKKQAKVSIKNEGTTNFRKSSNVKATNKEKVEAPVEKEVIKPAFLAKISSDYVSKTYNLAVLLNDKGEIAGIRTKNNKKNKIKTYGVDVLNKKITLVKALGVSLITLKCHEFHPEKGCRIDIEYPYNLTYGKFKNFNARILKKNDKWGLYVGDRKFTQMKLVAKKLLGLLVGIKSIEVH